MYLFQRQVIYYPSRETPKRRDYQAMDMQVVGLTTADGLQLHAWYKVAQINQPTLLYLHGNAGNIGNRIGFARQFIHAGFGLLLLEYRGYGGNKGRPTEKGLYEDGRAGLQFLQQQGVKPKSIVLYGESLGSGVATKLAQEIRSCAVVLQSPYTSLTELARYHYPWLLFLKTWDKFDSMSRIASIQAPLLILHGKKDDIVPFSQGVALFQRAHNPKEILSFELYGHNDLSSAPGFAEKVIEFVKLHCK